MPLDASSSGIVENGHFRLIKQVGSFLPNDVNTRGFPLPTVLFVGLNNFSFALAQETLI